MGRMCKLVVVLALAGAVTVGSANTAGAVGHHAIHVTGSANGPATLTLGDKGCDYRVTSKGTVVANTGTGTYKADLCATWKSMKSDGSSVYAVTGSYSSTVPAGTLRGNVSGAATLAWDGDTTYYENNITIHVTGGTKAYSHATGVLRIKGDSELESTSPEIELWNDLTFSGTVRV